MNYGRYTQQIGRDGEHPDRHQEKRSEAGARHHQDDAGAVLRAEKPLDKHGRQGRHRGGIGLPAAACGPAVAQEVRPAGPCRQRHHPRRRLQTPEVVRHPRDRTASRRHPRQLVR